MPPTVECCLHNVTAEFRATARAADVDVREAPCQDRCGVCHEGAFLIVDGEVRTGADHAAILRSIDGLDTAGIDAVDGGETDGQGVENSEPASGGADGKPASGDGGGKRASEGGNGNRTSGDGVGERR